MPQTLCLNSFISSSQTTLCYSYANRRIWKLKQRERLSNLPKWMVEVRCELGSAWSPKQRFCKPEICVQDPAAPSCLGPAKTLTVCWGLSSKPSLSFSCCPSQCPTQHLLWPHNCLVRWADHILEAAPPEAQTGALSTRRSHSWVSGWAGPWPWALSTEPCCIFKRFLKTKKPLGEKKWVAKDGIWHKMTGHMEGNIPNSLKLLCHSQQSWGSWGDPSCFQKHPVTLWNQGTFVIDPGRWEHFLGVNSTEKNRERKKKKGWKKKGKRKRFSHDNMISLIRLYQLAILKVVNNIICKCLLSACYMQCCEVLHSAW